MAADTHGQSVHDCVARHARLRPLAIALRLGDSTVDYGELHGRADRLAARLRGLGAGPDDVVGILLPRGIGFPIAALGVLRAGAAYLPLEWATPDARLACLLAEAGVRRVVTDGAGSIRIPSGTTPVPLDGAGRAGRPAPPPHPDQLAYVVATSGSTGQPKLVAIAHRGLAAHGRAACDRYGLGPADRVLQLAGVSFDVAAEEVFPTWLAGAEVVVAPAAAPALHELEDLVAAHAVTVVNVPASYFHLWVRDLGERGRRPPACLRLVVTGSEAVSGEAVRRWLDLAGVPVINAYGVAEATITATTSRHGPGAAAAGGIVPIGRPIAGMAASVLDADLVAVPAGATGELCLAGPGLARGYLGRPALTADAFRPDPTPGVAGGRLYRTGDRVRLGPNGWLEYLGRNDDQLKVRGVRIEPAEVVAALRAHPDVLDAHVGAAPGAGVSRLVAYVVPRDARRLPGGRELRAFLAERLPDSLVPELLVVLDALPRTPGGKVDRRALPDPAPARVPAADAGSAWPALTGPQRAVADAFAAVLDAEWPGPDDDFFDLGGSSLLAIEIAARLHAATGVRLGIDDVFAAPTVAGLAARLAAASPAEDALAAPVAAAAGGGTSPLSTTQEQVWFLCRLEPGNPAYHSQTTMRCAGPLDLALLERALSELVRRHEMLRTTFEEAGGLPRQVVHPPAPVRVALVDVSHLPEAEREAACESAIEESLARPFDLGRLPLQRWTAVRLRAEEHELVLVEHHLLHDGWSFALLVRELQALYDAFGRGRPSPLAPPALQYADFARWQRAALDGGALRGQLAHWTGALAGMPLGLSLPADRPRPRRQTFRGDLVRLELPGRLRRDLRRLGRGRRTTLFAVLAAAFAVLLHRHTGERDLCVGSAFANRRLPGTESLMGMLVNTVVLRWDLAGEPTFRAVMDRTRELVLAATANQELPFGALVEAVNPPRDSTRNPLVQVMFSADDSPLPAIELGPCAVTIYERHNGTAKLDLNVIVEPRAERQTGSRGDRRDDRITLLWEYNSDLLERSTIEAMGRRYTALLEAAVAAPDTPISRLPLSDPDERRALTGWRAGAALPVPERTVDELVVARARAAPEALAVDGPDGRLTYGELDRRSSRLAARLAAAGAGPERIVGLLARRSAGLAIGALATLRSGVAYLPLDPDHPPDRLRQVVAGARPVAVPAQTAERFRPHPAPDRPGRRLYRTGDLVRWRPDGRLDFLGRTDDPGSAGWAAWRCPD